jgi:hypothetical protein
LDEAKEPTVDDVGLRTDATTGTDVAREAWDLVIEVVREPIGNVAVTWNDPDAEGARDDEALCTKLWMLFEEAFVVVDRPRLPIESRIGWIVLVFDTIDAVVATLKADEDTTDAAGTDLTAVEAIELVRDPTKDGKTAVVVIEFVLELLLLTGTFWVLTDV